ncbi:hypothetical protein H6P81_007747 [Aristolochia fimbriata]|uniref:KIB1-4 beta-propeller domain-containing protein n=1 Tax=Aristolochia fimbriata TaxID=158543 RepID=A0AAV7F1F0_ARIFI|nr:hypothetical protein H6P81_007747 [Aristolochia fimbriata]
MIEVDEAWEQSLLQQGYVFTDEEEYGDDYGDDEDIIRCNKAWPIDSEEVDWWKENAPPVDRDLRYRTIFFGVYRMDLEAKEWIKMDSLGDRSFFVGFNTSFSVEASDIPGSFFVQRHARRACASCVAAVLPTVRPLCFPDRQPPRLAGLRPTLPCARRLAHMGAPPPVGCQTLPLPPVAWRSCLAQPQVPAACALPRTARTGASTSLRLPPHARAPQVARVARPPRRCLRSGYKTTRRDSMIGRLHPGFFCPSVRGCHMCTRATLLASLLRHRLTRTSPQTYALTQKPRQMLIYNTMPRGSHVFDCRHHSPPRVWPFDKCHPASVPTPILASTGGPVSPSSLGSLYPHAFNSACIPATPLQVTTLYTRIRNPIKQANVRKVLEEKKVKLVAFQETKVEVVDESLVRDLVPFNNPQWAFLEASGTAGGILIVWDTLAVSFESQELGQFCLGVKVRDVAEDQTRGFGVDNFWEEMGDLLCQWDTPWLLARDFNVIRYRHEKSPPPRTITSTMRKFNDFVDAYELEEIPTSGKRSGTVGGKVVLDHWPIFLDTRSGSWGHKPFRFENWWLKEDGFQELLKTWWEELSLQGPVGDRVAMKLKMLKKKLIDWVKLKKTATAAQRSLLRLQVDALDALEEGRHLTKSELSDC